jgi:hypothetical protein
VLKWLMSGKLIRQVPPQDESYWVIAKRLFPAWPGFAPERCSITLRDIMTNLRDQSRSQVNFDWEGLLDP